MNETEALIQLVNLINNSNGIPLNVIQTSTTNPYQFYLTLLMGSFAVIFLFGNLLVTRINSIIALVNLYFLKKKTKRGVIVIKHTSQELFSQSMIDRKTMDRVEKALVKMKGKPFDLILYTPGGEIFSAVYISRMLRNYGGNIRAIVPIYSMSGGTLLALSCDEIYMNNHSCLGAVDPQLGNLFKFGSARSWKEVMRVKGNKAEDSSISFRFIGEQYTKSIRENIKVLLENKCNKKDLNKLSEYLTSGEIEHGYNMTKDVLRSKGLEIKDIPEDTNVQLSKILRIMPEGVTFKV